MWLLNANIIPWWLQIGLKWQFHLDIWYSIFPKCSAICKFDPWVELRYSAFMCIQLLTCRNFRAGTCRMHAWTGGMNPGVSTLESYSCVWTCSHSTRSAICATVQSLVWRLPSCGWTEKGSGSGKIRESITWGNCWFLFLLQDKSWEHF